MNTDVTKRADEVPVGQAFSFNQKIYGRAWQQADTGVGHIAAFVPETGQVTDFPADKQVVQVPVKWVRDD